MAESLVEANNTPPPAASSGTQVVPPSTQAQMESAKSWRDTYLPPELKGEKTFEKFQDVAALAKSYLHAEKAIPAGKVAIPHKTANEADWRNFFYEIGLPKEAKDYSLTKSQESTIDDEFLNKYKEFAYGKGILPNHAQAVVDFIEQSNAEYQKAHGEAVSKQAEEGLLKLKQEWGNDFQYNYDLAKNLIKDLNDPEFNQVLQETGMDSDPRVIKAVHKLALGVKEPSMVGKQSSKMVVDRDSLMKEKMQLMDSKSPYMDGKHPSHYDAVKRMTEIMNALVPEQKQA